MKRNRINNTLAKPQAAACGLAVLFIALAASGAHAQRNLKKIPNPDPEIIFPVHQFLLAKSGIYVLENIRTDELVADSAWEFLFVLGQPKFVGAVQMVINPVAIR